MNASIVNPNQTGMAGAGINGILARRPYIATNGRHRGQPVIAQKRDDGKYHEVLVTNATLRKDEWINLEDVVYESARERLVITGDLPRYNAGGLGTIISEWEQMSEMTDAKINMDGESSDEMDRQQFSLQGVPIPVVQKSFQISERMLQASRQRGASIDTTYGAEASRAVSRVSEDMIFYGANIGGVNSAGTSYSIPGLTTYSDRETFTISDWSDTTTPVTPETIHGEILDMVKKLEIDARHYGPFNLYIPGEYASRFREDYKAAVQGTLQERVEAENVISRVRVSDRLKAGNVLLVEMSRSVIDLAVASDLTTVQWESGSGWTTHFQVFASWAPRIKSDYEGRTGICHGST